MALSSTGSDLHDQSLGFEVLSRNSDFFAHSVSQHPLEFLRRMDKMSLTKTQTFDVKCIYSISALLQIAQHNMATKYLTMKAKTYDLIIF